MQKALQASAVIYGLGAAVASLLLGAGLFLAQAATVGLGDQSSAVIVFSLIAVGSGLGLMLAWAGWRGLAGLPSHLLQAPPFLLLVALFLASVVLGELVLRSGVDLLFPPVNLLAALLPPLALVALVSIPLQRAGAGLTRRDLALQFAFGGLVATVLSGLAQLAAAIGVVAGAALLVTRFPGGLDAVEELAALLQSPEALSDPQALVSQLMSPPLVLAALLFVAVLVPALEEVLKSLGVALLAVTRGRLSPAQAFAMGVMAGAGFSFVEALFSGAAIPADGWASTVVLRGGTALIHGLATGLIALGWQAALVERRFPRAMGYAVAGIALHGAWNGLAVVAALVTADLASGTPVPMATSLAPTYVLPLLALWLLAVVTLLLLTRRLAAAEPGYGELPAVVSEP